MTILFWQVFLMLFHVIIEWFGSNSSSNSLFEILSIKEFLVDFLMCVCITFMALKILKLSLSGLFLINTQESFFLLVLVFLFHSQYFYHYDLIHQRLLLIYTHWKQRSILQPKTLHWACIFSPSNTSFVDSNTVCSF